MQRYDKNNVLSSFSFITLCFKAINNGYHNAKRAFANAKASRTLVFLYLIYIMYKDRDLKPYFSDFFSRKDYIKQRKRKIKRSFVKRKQRLTSVFLYIIKSIPYSSSHILTVLSPEPLIIFVPSGLNATEETLFECPSKV